MANDARVDAARCNLTDDYIAEAARDLEDAKAKLETAKAKYRLTRKHLKSNGIHLGQLDAVLLLKKADADEVLGEQRTFIRYARVLALPLGSQLSLLDEEPPAVALSETAQEEQKAWDAGQQGYDAGKKGEPRENNRYPAGTLAFAAWDEGHRRGKAVLDEGLVPRRGRPPKAPAEAGQAAA